MLGSHTSLGGAAMLRRGAVIALCLMVSALAGGVFAADDGVRERSSNPPRERGVSARERRARLAEPDARKEMSAAFANRRRQAKAAAWEVAIRAGRQPWGQVGGVYYELMAIKRGVVYVMRTLNLHAAVSVAVDQVRDMPPYELSGQGQTVGVWDGGSARASHQELSGRVTVGDGASPVDHSTHVTGTIAAAGVKERALGMAPDVRIASYDFDEDLAEVALLAMSSADEPNKIQVSNHSYGWVCGWDYSSFLPVWYGTWGNRESDMFGNYDAAARDWDALCYAAPYYLPFKAAGNDRTDSVPAPGARFEYYNETHGWQVRQYELNSDPYPDGWDQGGYDTLPPDATFKNGVTVGAVDMVNTSERDLGAMKMTSFSSWGPTDDGRIKPDLVADGIDVYSCTAGSDRSYDTYSGTSMATAVACGGATLLPEFWARFSPDQAMRSATIKALLIHTADDLGNAGPDYRYGWGLINVQAAIEHIETHFGFPESGVIIEDALDLETTNRIYSFVWDGSSTIRATLVWTDPPGRELEGLDNPTLCLVNDLDLRIIDPEGTLYRPFILDPAQPNEPATSGNNTRDNVEQVLIETPLVSGTYHIGVSHKGTLADDRQEFSLLLSGQQLGQQLTVDNTSTISTDK